MNLPLTKTILMWIGVTFTSMCAAYLGSTILLALGFRREMRRIDKELEAARNA